MTISLTLFLPMSLIFVFLIVIMYVCRATFLSQVLACTSLYVLRIIIIIIVLGTYYLLRSASSLASQVSAIASQC